MFEMTLGIKHTDSGISGTMGYEREVTSPVFLSSFSPLQAFAFLFRKECELCHVQPEILVQHELLGLTRLFGFFTLSPRGWPFLQKSQLVLFWQIKSCRWLFVIQFMCCGPQIQWPVSWFGGHMIFFCCSSQMITPHRLRTTMQPLKVY